MLYQSINLSNRIGSGSYFTASAHLKWSIIGLDGYQWNQCTELYSICDIKVFLDNSLANPKCVNLFPYLLQTVKFLFHCSIRWKCKWIGALCMH